MLTKKLKSYGWIPLWLGIVTTALLCRPPLPIDETRYLSVVWEMWQSHQFLVPHINGLPYSHKPPLLFWLIRGGWEIFGVNDWSARLTAPLFGLFTILLSLRLAGKLWPEQHMQTVVPYLFLGTLFWSFYSTLTMFEMPLTCFALLGWLALWRGIKEKSALCWVIYGLATGLGILTKGPVILVYMAPPALLAPWWMDKKRTGSWKTWYGGFLMAVAGGLILALAWALPAAKTGGEEYGRMILLGQTAGRMVHSFAHQRPFYWYFPLLPFLLFPWVFLPKFWIGLRRLHLTAQIKFCLAIIVPGFLIFSFISGKQIHYLLPLLPPTLLLISQVFATVKTEKSSVAGLLPMALLLLSLALFILPFLPLQGGDSEMLRFLPPWLGVIPLITIFPVRRKMNANQRIVHTSIPMVLMLIGFHLSLNSPLHMLYDETVIGEKIHSAQNSNKQVAVYPARLADQFQFTGRLTRPVLPMDTIEAIVHWSQTHRSQYVLMLLKKKVYPFFKDTGIVRPLAGKWLVFRPADGVLADYQHWKTDT